MISLSTLNDGALKIREPPLWSALQHDTPLCSPLHVTVDAGMHAVTPTRLLAKHVGACPSFSAPRGKGACRRFHHDPGAPKARRRRWRAQGR